VVVADDDGLRIALRAEGVSGGGKLLAQLDVVVDLTVEDQGVALRVLRGAPHQRLVRVLEVDDRQAVEAE
jgi:hypothetical protein